MSILGYVAQGNDWPWFVSFGFRRDVTVHEHFCGASIIGKRFLLTAAHCCDRIEEQRKPLSFRDSTNQDIDVQILEWVNHPKYSSEIYNYDFCLMLTDRAIEYGDNIQPISLMNQGEALPLIGSSIYIAGRGLMDDKDGNHVGTTDLREAEVELMTYKYCNSDEVYTGFVNPASMFCAGYPKGGIDACQGDSGGPAIIIKSNESGTKIRARLLGLSSWGKGCAEEGWPGVYARTSGAYDWVMENARTMLLNNVFTTTTTSTTTTTTPPGPMPLSQMGLDNYECESSWDGTRSDGWRIIGGFTSENIIESWPWMANLNGQCGASIIASQYLLTAAHCCMESKLEGGVAYVGSGDFINPNEQQKLNIASWRIHGGWNKINFQNDICVVKVKG